MHGTASRSLEPRPPARSWGVALALGGLALIAAATLTPSSDTVPPPWCLRCALNNPGLAADSIANVFLFVPFGVGLRLAGLRAAAILPLALATSLAVELIQAYVVPGRVPNFIDLATNTIGAALAAVATPRWRAALLPTKTAAVVLALVWTGGLVTVVAVSGWALAPAGPGEPLTVSEVGVGDGPARPERVLRASLDGRAIRAGDTVGAPWAHGREARVRAELQARPSGLQGELAVMLVADSLWFLWLGIDHDELELEVRRRGDAVRFRSPSVRILRAGAAGTSASRELDTLRLGAGVGRWRMSLDAQTRGGLDEREVQLHLLSGWTLLLPSPRSPVSGELLTALWSALLVLPLAYWSAAATRRGSPVALLALVLVGVAGLLTGSAAVGAPWPPASALAAGAVTAVGAWRLERALSSG